MAPRNWTDPEKRDIKNFEPGQYLLFHKATKEGQIENAYCVTGVNGRFVETVDLAGKKVSFSQKQAKAFSVFERKEFDASVGDKLLFTANAKRDGFECVNGHQAVIASFDEKGRAVLNTGQTVPENFFQLNLGAAITVFKSQGKTVDHVISCADAMNWEQSYVAWSRARESVVIFTTDKEALMNSIAHSGERPSAMNLEAQATAAADGVQHPRAGERRTDAAGEVDEYRLRRMKQARQDVEINGSVYRWREQDGYHEADHAVSAFYDLQLERELERGRGGI